ncbi:MAG: hypothetical protein ABIH78_05000 [Candidatus Peregrinibacteria bacterium]
MKKLNLILSIIFLAFITVSIIFYNYYSLIENQSNHTGLDLIKVKIVYLMFSAITFVLAYAIKSNKKAKKIFVISGILSLLFVANIWIFEKTGIMLYYEDWILHM